MSWLDLKMRPTSFGDNKRKPSTAFVELEKLSRVWTSVDGKGDCQECHQPLELCRCPLP